MTNFVMCSTGEFSLVYKVTDWKTKLKDTKPSRKNLEILVEGAKGFLSEMW